MTASYVPAESLLESRAFRRLLAFSLALHVALFLIMTLRPHRSAVLISPSPEMVNVVDVPNPNGLRVLDNQCFALSQDAGSMFLWDAGSGPTGAATAAASAEVWLSMPGTDGSEDRRQSRNARTAPAATT